MTKDDAEKIVMMMEAGLSKLSSEQTIHCKCMGCTFERL